MRDRKEMLIGLAERYLYHKQKVNSDIPVVSDIARKMCEVDIAEMWMLTQTLGVR